MTIKELMNWCRRQRDKEAQVYVCKDWEQVEDGNLTDEDAIVNRYGLRIADRFAEMFDLLGFDNPSYRPRL